ncbi:39S ribosomal protein L39, mitochondrial [Copidosoma floridanum]|uniref:39S ribosomal protein L39, mitochondrial n=1 Tax=Copidosoma floridanum TaxID=29053 RepID=UPI0006C95049|nr:39S ribosomal protein L39, mitochondrial [Copidosoma floridanum]
MMIQGFRSVCRLGLRVQPQLQPRRFSSKDASNTGTSIKAEWRKRRNIIFDNEVGRLQHELGRVEKIMVKFQPTSEEDKVIEMAMNKSLSTPSDCAKHVSDDIYQYGAIALVNGQPWDMNRPLEQNCDLKILTMRMPEQLPSVNSAFWRTCSFLLGAMIESSFKDHIQLYLHSFPRPNVKSGSYVHDAVIDLPDWKPTAAEMRALSAQFVKLTNDALPLERLEVTESLALDMFQDNPYKSKQIPEIAKLNDGKVILYRAGDHIDISKGPMVGHTSIIGKTTIAAVHKIQSDEVDRMYRFQGISVARGTHINHFVFSILEDRAKNLNESVWVPQKLHVEAEERTSIAAKN